MNEIFIGKNQIIRVKTNDPMIRSRILSYKGRPGMKIISSRPFVAEIPTSWIHIIEPKQPWQDIKGMLPEEYMPDFASE